MAIPRPCQPDHLVPVALTRRQDREASEVGLVDEAEASVVDFETVGSVILEAALDFKAAEMVSAVKLPQMLLQVQEAVAALIEEMEVADLIVIPERQQEAIKNR